MRILLEAPFSLYEIKASLKSPISDGDEKIIIKAISTDSRICQSGDLFIALEGEHKSGEDFVTDAKSKEAYTVCKRSDYADICVKDTEQALLDIAKAYKSRFSLKETVVITGSVGKTTTKNLTATILSEKFRTHATKGNLNNTIGVPYTVLSMPLGTEVLVVEAGMNHSGELKRISECIEPTLAIITNIGTAHIGNLGSREGIARAKMEIIDSDTNTLTLIPEGEPLLGSIKNSATVSASLESAEFFLKSENSNPQALEFTYFSPSGTFKSEKIESGGLYLKECMAFAIAAALILGLNEAQILAALNVYSANAVTNREAVGSITVIDDSYNASPESVKLALKSLTLGTKQPRSALLGDMLELGDFSEKYHYSIGKFAAECGLSHLYLIGKHAEYIKRGAIAGGMAEECVFYNPDTERPDISARDIFSNSRGEAVLFKASRGIRIERVKQLLKKYFNEE